MTPERVMMSHPVPVPASDRLRVARWSSTLGSNVRSRGTVVIESGDHRWEATAKGGGPVEALFKAVDDALHEVLDGHPRLLSYDVHAVAEGVDAQGRVTVRIAPPSQAPGPRANGAYEGVAHSGNIVAASIEAYVRAIETMLAEDHWHGATDAAGNFRAARADQHPQPEYDPHVRPDYSRWWR